MKPARWLYTPKQYLQISNFKYMKNLLRNRIIPYHHLIIRKLRYELKRTSEKDFTTGIKENLWH